MRLSLYFSNGQTASWIGRAEHITPKSCAVLYPPRAASGENCSGFHHGEHHSLRKIVAKFLQINFVLEKYMQILAQKKRALRDRRGVYTLSVRQICTNPPSVRTKLTFKRPA